MQISIIPKDTTQKLTLEVRYVWTMNNALWIRTMDDKIRVYPFIHIWYVEYPY